MRSDLELIQDLTPGSDPSHLGEALCFETEEGLPHRRRISIKVAATSMRTDHPPLAGRM